MAEKHFYLKMEGWLSAVTKALVKQKQVLIRDLDWSPPAVGPIFQHLFVFTPAFVSLTLSVNILKQGFY